MNGVHPSQPYRDGAMGSLGDAAYMLIRQHQFPDNYEDRDRHLIIDHDRLVERDGERVSECFDRHTGTGELGFGQWARHAANEEVIALLAELLKVKDVPWTGYRIMGTVHRGNGFPVWTLELFAKHPNSKTKVFSGKGRRESCVEIKPRVVAR